MNLKNILPAILCVLVGFFMSNFMFTQYQKEDTITTSSTTNSVYFMQIGVYSSLDNMKENLKNIETYIYEEKNNLYYAYVGIVKNENNLEKVEGYFKSLDYVIYRKEKTVSNVAFQEVLSQYDLMLEETEDSKTIGTIMSQVISKYEELVLNDED
jgi:multidrug efflux pump subunit AcrB